jgi:hypothetical protein
MTAFIYMILQTKYGILVLLAGYQRDFSNFPFKTLLNDDIRVKSVWTFGGQIRFKTNESEQVYKTKSLSDTYDTIIKPGG